MRVRSRRRVSVSNEIDGLSLNAGRNASIKIAYFVHDVNDAAVARRVTMLRAAGAAVTVAGFRRDDRLPKTVSGARVVDLGRTADARLLQRAMVVFRNLLRPKTMLEGMGRPDVIIARNLESLALAVRARREVPTARLVYECLDIHRSLLGSSVPHRIIQRIESALLKSIDLLIVSSPAFVREYFSKKPGFGAPVLLVENKVLTLEAEPHAEQGALAGPPWTIGWFGNLRCRRTFDTLAALAARSDGRVRILIAGRSSPAVFDDFAALVERSPNCTFVGSFTPEDLGTLYAQCHFAWAIDYFEEGLNSSWLLPNRLYEASGFGAVPIALKSVETGRWLARYDAGWLIDDTVGVEGMAAMFENLDLAGYAKLYQAVAAIPREALIADRSDCDKLLHAVAGR
jgi:succinoglycan biosynthesis protein ExoL